MSAIARSPWGVVVVLAVTCRTGPGGTRAGASVGKVVNPGFEADANGDGLPDGWEFIGGDGGRGQLALDAGHTGRRAARVTCQLMAGRWGPGVGQVGTVAVREGSHYRVSFRARSDPPVQLTVGLHDTANWRHCGLWHTVSVREEWRRFRVIFRASKACAETTRLQFSVNAEATVWIDDVALEPSGPPENEALLDVAGAKNLVPNASFELGTTGWGTCNADRLFGEIDSTTAAHGASSVKIVLAPDRYPVYYNDFTYQLHAAPSHGPVTSLPLANVGWIPLRKGETYTLSMWLKTDKPGLTVKPGVRYWPSGESTRELAVDAGWKRCELRFKSEQASGFVTITPVLADPERERATLWVDGVQLEQSEKATPFETQRPVEIAVSTTKPANIFHAGDDVVLDQRLFNCAATPRRVTWHVTITDFFDRPVVRTTRSADVPPGAAVRQPLVSAVSAPGFYRLTVRLKDGGHTQERPMRFAVVFPYAKTYPGADSQFGINHAFISDHFMRLAMDAGVTWVRSWFAKWDDVERRKGQFDFSEADVQLGRLERLGCHVLGCLATPASRWSSSAPADLAGRTGAEAEPRRHWWRPTRFDDYENYVHRVVDRFRNRIRHWEVFNEPSDRKGGPNSNLDLEANYITFLRRARAGARRADPSSQVLGAGYQYVSNAIETQDALREMDIVSEHVYPKLAHPAVWQRRWDALAAKLAAAGGPRPIWLTEYGIYADDDPDPSTAQSRFMVQLDKDSEREAATHVVQHYVIALAGGVRKAFFHIGNWPWQVNREHGCGFHMFFEYGGAPRKTYVAHNVLAWMLTPAARFHRRLSAGPVLFAYEFRTPERTTFVAWRTKSTPLPDSVRSALSGDGMEVRNVAGREVRAELTHLGPSPIYVRCKPNRADAVAAALALLRRP